jgi:hypothetical protein
LLGPGTEAYAKITAAYAALANVPADEVRDAIILGSAAIHRKE